MRKQTATTQKLLATTPKLFAEDTCVFANHRDLHTLQTILNSELNNLAKWCNANQLTINPSKSNVLLIPPKLNASYENLKSLLMIYPYTQRIIT